MIYPFVRTIINAASASRFSLKQRYDEDLWVEVTPAWNCPVTLIVQEGFQTAKVGHVP
jgi:hypothetical protein